MKIDMNNMIDSILDNIENIQAVRLKDIPNIPLYMDQVTTFMDSQLTNSKRYEEDKILTKTMINNYAKNNLLPPPNKKKYNKEHILLLIYIYYFKNLLSIKDIEKLLEPLTNSYIKKDNDLTMSDIYTQVYSLEKETIAQLKEDVKKSYDFSNQTFTDLPENEQNFLQTFSFICALSFDVYIKKQIIEELIDSLPSEHREMDDSVNKTN